MENIEKQLREEAKKLLAEKKVDVIVGYEEGTLPYQAAPCFIEDPESAERLVWNKYCSVNLAKYVHDLIFQHKESQKRTKPEERTKKIVGVVARGCTTRSIVLHLQEKQYDRDQVVVIGVPCTGYISKKKLAAAVDGKEVIECSVAGDALSVTTVDGTKDIPLKEVTAANCLTCRFNNPVISDMMIGDPAPAMDVDNEYKEVDEFESLSEEERWTYFTKEMGKCIRCYACRNTCPSCYCKVCFVEQSQPKWVGAGIDETDTQVFQFMRMFHMAGRCVDCGSCLEVCPMGVDLRTFLKKLDKDAYNLFDEYRVGESLDTLPPLSAHSTEDKEEFIFEP
ncbi:MAG: 4Fe-4S dicluster domain-containing protein [Deltaproteobacteria bacterium]|nr:4Fe-4S dicluster domain-containing protein [Deltaproteobacteria bacterium]MBN2844759.1 4Fe-4S dicluster domain-containing protein [Deltaproteobacteria bacterium]